MNECINRQADKFSHIYIQYFQAVHYNGLSMYFYINIPQNQHAVRLLPKYCQFILANRSGLACPHKKNTYTE